MNNKDNRVFMSRNYRSDSWPLEIWCCWKLAYVPSKLCSRANICFKNTSLFINTDAVADPDLELREGGLISLPCWPFSLHVISSFFNHNREIRGKNGGPPGPCPRSATEMNQLKMALRAWKGSGAFAKLAPREQHSWKNADRFILSNNVQSDSWPHWI